MIAGRKSLRFVEAANASDIEGTSSLSRSSFISSPFRLLLTFDKFVNYHSFGERISKKGIPDVVS